MYGGAWDALASNRADLVVGAPGEGPAGGGYSTRPLGTVQWQFMVAPTHPLASAPEPIPPEEIRKHRSVTAADSSRSLPPRTAGLLSGQDVLTVPDMRSKSCASAPASAWAICRSIWCRRNSRPGSWW